MKVLVRTFAPTMAFSKGDKHLTIWFYAATHGMLPMRETHTTTFTIQVKWSDR